MESFQWLGTLKLVLYGHFHMFSLYIKAVKLHLHGNNIVSILLLPHSTT